MGLVWFFAKTGARLALPKIIATATVALSSAFVSGYFFGKKKRTEQKDKNEMGI